MSRLHFTSEDISEAIINAGIELRPEDCFVTKFNLIADELGKKARKQMQAELDMLSEKVLW